MEAGTPDQAFAEAKSTSSDVQAPQQELIDANDVLKALKAFVEEHNKHRVRHVVLLWLLLVLFFLTDQQPFSLE